MGRIKVVFAALLLVLAAACASPADKIPLGTSAFSAPDSTLMVQGGELHIAPLDVLDVKVFGLDGYGGSYQVDPRGQIKFPLIGLIEAQGYTTFEFADILETKLKEKYLQNPMVTIRITEFNGQQVTIDGSVGKPGMYPVRGPMTLVQALAVSGGVSNNANLGGILIFRTISGKRQVARFDLRKIRTGDGPDPLVYGNDLIVVDGREKNDTYEEVLRSLPLLGAFAIF